MKEFIRKVKQKISDFLFKVKKTAREVIPVGIEFVNAMKKITDSDSADLFVELTPFGWDNSLLKTLRVLFPKILKELGEWDETLGKSDEEILHNVIIKINNYQKVKRSFKRVEIAALINAELSGGMLTVGESLVTTQAVYDDPDLLKS